MIATATTNSSHNVMKSGSMIYFLNMYIEREKRYTNIRSDQPFVFSKQTLCEKAHDKKEKHPICYNLCAVNKKQKTESLSIYMFSFYKFYLIFSIHKFTLFNLNQQTPGDKRADFK